MFFLLFLCWCWNDFFEFYLFFRNLSFENVERFGNGFDDNFLGLIYSFSVSFSDSGMFIIKN